MPQEEEHTDWSETTEQHTCPAVTGRTQPWIYARSSMWTREGRTSSKIGGVPRTTELGDFLCQRSRLEGQAAVIGCISSRAAVTNEHKLAYSNKNVLFHSCGG